MTVSVTAPTIARRRGRPRAPLPNDAAAQVASGALEGATDRDLAAMLGVSVSTLQANFQAILCKQRALRRMAIRKAQFEAALKGNPALLIWLGKQSEERGGLGQADEATISGPIDYTKLSEVQLRAIAGGEKSRGG